MPEPIFSYYQDIAGVISSEMDYVVRDSCCTGGAIAQAYWETGAMSFLSETGTSFQPAAPSMREEVERVLPGAYKFIDFAMPVSGKVVDAETGEPIFAGPLTNMSLPNMNLHTFPYFIFFGNAHVCASQTDRQLMYHLAHAAL